MKSCEIREIFFNGLAPLGYQFAREKGKKKNAQWHSTVPQYFINISFRTEVNNNTVIDEKYNLFVFNRGDTIEYHRGLQSRELGQAPMQLVGRRYHLTRVIRWSDCISYRIEIVCQIGTLSTILQQFLIKIELQWRT